MTVDAYEFRIDGRPTEESRVDRPRPEPFLSPRTTGWTPAHSEVVRFLGECFAVGAVLGLATELARPLWDPKHG
jgi:hypothetical protein